MDWSQAKCSGMPVEDFFPVGVAHRHRHNEVRDSEALQAEVGRRVCKGGDGKGKCPILEECLSWAIVNNEKDGVFGGESEESRRAIRRRWRRRQIKVA